MQTNISNRTISSIKLQGKPYEIRDTALKGLLLRVQPSGVMTYYMEYRRGKRVKIGRGDAITPVQARELAKSVLADVYQGGNPSDKRQKGREQNYLQFLEEAYKPWLVSNLRTGEATFDRLKKSFPELHRLSLQEITPLVIEKWRTRRKQDEMKPASINRELADLKACLSRAVEWELLEKHPLDRVKPCKLDSNAKVRFLSAEEERKLRLALDNREQSLVDNRESANEWRTERGYHLQASLKTLAYADYLKPAVLLSLNTGLRRGELFGLQWSDVDLEQKNLTVTAATAKSGKTRHVPLNKEALRVLREWKKQPGMKSSFVFCGRTGEPFHDVRDSWSALLGKAEIKDFRWHDLRHTFASKLVMAGVDLNTVRELLGHSDYKMTLRYAHLAPEHKAAAVNKLLTMAVAP